MKVLSVKNPYAYLIIHGIKDVENRSWKTDYRGELLIHCSGKDQVDIYDDDIPKEILKEFDEFWKAKDNNEDYQFQNEFARKLADLDIKTEKIIIKDKQIFYLSGLILGKVTLTDIVRDSKSIWAEKNCYHWILENPVVFNSPIEAKGKLGLWNYAE